MKSDILSLKQQQYQLLQKKKEMQAKLPHLYGWPWYSWARAFFESINPVNLICAANQISKALCVNTLIPTPIGFTKLEDIKIGDFVYGRDGMPTQVVDIPYVGTDTCYRVTFNDGSAVVSSGDHDWICKGYRERFRKRYTCNFDRSKRKGLSFENSAYGAWIVESTKNIVLNGEYNPETISPKRYAIPICDSINYLSDEELFDPYLIGLILGDGGISNYRGGPTLTSCDSEILDYVRSRYNTTPRGGIGIYIKDVSHIFNSLGLINIKSAEKFIPEQYFYGSEEERLELLRGLMDTDGTINNLSNVSFTTVSPKLRDGVVRLVCSLGGTAKVTKHSAGYTKDNTFVKCKDAYSIRMKILKNPFKITRKADRHYKTRYKHERVIRKIECLGEISCKCITVDNDDGSFLCTENYIVTHNSSTQIRKMIHWATATHLWPKLWKTPPRQFWYLYPSRDIIDAEFRTKWVPEFLPREEMKDHPQYGWEIKNKQGLPNEIIFKSGVSCFLKAYTQDVMNLQSGTVAAIFTDEELVENLYDELMLRLAASDGYFHMVFTATRGQDFWRRAIERIGCHDEVLRNAFKQQISMYDCLQYEDGSPSPWTKAKIKRVEAKCKSKAEIEKRVYGKFVLDSGLKYPEFNKYKNVVKPYPIPREWNIYGGVDIGSGGAKAHPAAMALVAVRPDYKKGAVIKGWRGARGVLTTSSDILTHYRMMRGDLRAVNQYYDHSAADFHTYASRLGETFLAAEKGNTIGEDVINTLFKHNMLDIFDTPELEGLPIELASLLKETDKKYAVDDYVDAMRYAVTKIPWDWTAISDELVFDKKTEGPILSETEKRRKQFMEGTYGEDEYQRVEEEIEAYNELFDY